MDTKANDILSVLHGIILKYPEQVAVVEGGKDVLTYQQLWSQALRVAGHVETNGGNSPFVGLKLPKSASYIVSMIGCWMAGKAFVPIGTDLPKARQEYILRHADISLCIDNDSFIENLSCPLKAEIAPCLPHHPAYMIYSSGTTGTPKGILVGHAGLSNLARCQRRTFGVTRQSRYLFFLSVNFDASISDILVTLTSGATLVIEPLSQEELASSLYDVIEKRKISHTDVPPSLIRLFDPVRCPDCLQTMVIGGEPADIDAVRRWSRKVRLINVYGPTEATVCTSMCQCDENWNAPLLGDVLDETRYQIYANGHLDATDGELWISGIGLAIGYYKNEELTQKKFPVVGGIRYYRTSDHVRMEGGRLEFVGRIDRQVKYHGQLVELEEIEKTLRRVRCVGNVAVVKRSAATGSPREAIVAFVQLANEGVLPSDAERQLRQCCKHHLPKWMVPSLFVFLDVMPLAPSGKTDLPALSAMPLKLPVGEAVPQYASEKEAAIAHAMADTLNLPAMGADDDFFLCGGDSLDVIILISRLQQMGMDTSPAQLRLASTPRRLAMTEVQDTSMCIHSSSLESQWQYTTCRTGQPAAASPVGCVFFTGATGFLGSHLLCELLSRNRQLKVKCLVRCSSSVVGMQRISDSFRRYGLDPSLLSSTEVVCGDLSQPRFGIPAALYEQLAAEATAVFHCAATVNMLAHYEALRGANVTGTRNVLDFCMTGIRKTLHYASTLSVFVSTDRNTGVASESDALVQPTNIYGGYAQTKFVAEKMVQSVSPSDCDVFIYRYGLLCGDTQHAVSAPKDFLGMFFRGARLVGTLPYDASGTMALDVTPVDQASRVVADIVSANTPGIYHVASDNPLRYNQLCAILQEEGIIRGMEDYAHWKHTVGAFGESAEAQALSMSLCRMDARQFAQMRYMDLFQATRIRFDMTNTHGASPHRCMHNKELIQRYIRQSL